MTIYRYSINGVVRLSPWRNIRRTLPFAAPSTVGSQRLSLESIKRNIASWSSTSFSSFATSAAAWSTLWGGIGCPGMGIDSSWPSASCGEVVKLNVSGGEWCEETSTHYTGEDLLEASGGGGGLGLPSVQAVLELEEGLANGVGEGDPRRVDERDLSNSPRLSSRLRAQDNRIGFGLTIRVLAT